MSYEINDRTLVNELCVEIKQSVDENQKRLKKEIEDQNKVFPEIFVHPLDDTIIGTDGILKRVLPDNEKTLSYSKADELDSLWHMLLEKSIKCLRYFDNREPFQDSPNKAIIAYGIDKLEDYHRKYTEFEGLMYGASSYYRDHVFHAIRVWMLGVFVLLKKRDGEQFIDKIALDGGAKSPREIDYFECISMWTVIALCHDLGYPLEKAEQILEKTRKMMKEFIPNPSVWNNFSYSGTQDNINEYILKFISTKMKEKLPENNRAEEKANSAKETTYIGRIQPKYYLKYAKSLEHFQHGIISTIIVYKMLLYFLESDFNLNDDYVYRKEDAQQFYIRREILRAMAAHTCPDAYDIHITTFPSLLFICDEMQEWGRKTWSELYTGLSENSITLSIEKFSKAEISVIETIDMRNVEDSEIVIQNICRIFERQYSLYKTTFRDGQDTAKRDFDLKKVMDLKLKMNGSETRQIKIEYGLPKAEHSFFKIHLDEIGDCATQTKYKEKINNQISKQLYSEDISFC